MLNFLFSFFSRKPSSFTGILSDNRPLVERLRDFRHEEFAFASTPKFEKKAPSTWNKYPLRSQNGSGSCVAQSFAQALGILNMRKTGEYIPLSAAFIYKRRSNKPDGGMFSFNAWDIVRRDGTTLEVLMPSMDMTDAQMDAITEQPTDPLTAQAFKIDSYVELPSRVSFDDVAALVEKGTPVIVWFQFTYPEWTDIPKILTDKPTLGHSVTAVDAVTFNGVQYIVIQDSWGVFGQFEGQRLISREFYETRNIYAGYPITFTYETKEKITHVWNTDMLSGQTSDDIKKLQEALQSLGFFPDNQVPTGFYGGVTAKAVYAFQKEQKIPGIDTLKGIRCGPATRAALNAVFK